MKPTRNKPREHSCNNCLARHMYHGNLLLWVSWFCLYIVINRKVQVEILTKLIPCHFWIVPLECTTFCSAMHHFRQKLLLFLPDISPSADRCSSPLLRCRYTNKTWALLPPLHALGTPCALPTCHAIAQYVGRRTEIIHQRNTSICAPCSWDSKSPCAVVAAAAVPNQGQHGSTRPCNFSSTTGKRFQFLHGFIHWL